MFVLRILRSHSLSGASLCMGGLIRLHHWPTHLRLSRPVGLLKNCGAGPVRGGQYDQKAPPASRPTSTSRDIDDADMHLFRKVSPNLHHVLAALIPQPKAPSYELRERRTIPPASPQLTLLQMKICSIVSLSS